MFSKHSLSSIRVPILSTAFLSSGCKEAFNSRLPCNVWTVLIFLKGMVAIREKKNYVKGMLVCYSQNTLRLTPRIPK